MRKCPGAEVSGAEGAGAEESGAEVTSAELSDHRPHYICPIRSTSKHEMSLLLLLRV